MKANEKKCQVASQAKSKKVVAPVNRTSCSSPLWILVGLVSLSFGILSPRLLQARNSFVFSHSSNNNKSDRKLTTTKSPSPKLIVRSNTQSSELADTATTKTMAPASTGSRHSKNRHDFACDKEALAQVLHENPVQGLHFLCMNQGMKSLRLVFFPGAQHTDAPPTVEMEGLPEWEAFRETIMSNFGMRHMDELHQPWGMFSLNGDLLVNEHDDQVEMVCL